MKQKYIKIETIDEIGNYVMDKKNPIIMIIKKGSKTSGFYGKVYRDIFGMIYGNETKGLSRIINNFTKYEQNNGRFPFIFIMDNINIDENDVNFDEDSEWVVHSTDKKSLDSIIKSGKLFSWLELDKQKINYLDFGRKILNEPIDYYDFIEFGDINGLTEIIVASKIHNNFVDENIEYTPGGRIYIKKDDLKKQKNYIDFLNHYVIKGVLDLFKVKNYIVAVEDFENKIWTPKTFSIEANKKLLEIVKKEKW
jgi:hypothetical protein